MQGTKSKANFLKSSLVNQCEIHGKDQEVLDICQKYEAWNMQQFSLILKSISRPTIKN